MTERTRRLLQYDQVAERVAGFCRSPQGAELVASADIQTNEESVDALQDAVAEARAVLNRSEDKPSLSFPEIRHLFSPLSKAGTVLEAEDLAGLASHVRSATALARFFTKHLSAGDLLFDSAAKLPECTGLLRDIEHYLEPTGELKDVAELKEIRSKIQRATKNVTRTADGYMRSSDMDGFWTSDTAPQRDGRVVLPLHANYRGRVRGVVHEVSATGTTVYVEPADLMDANNELRSAHDEYRQEVHRILTKLTGQARAVQGELRQVADGVSYLDAALGRAEFAEKLTCVRPARAGQVVHLSQARHPLLGTEAVPIDIVYPEHVTSLVITGPNTGGKTVALKTLGLLAMLNQSGIPVPADEGSKLPIFDAIYADIGDEQSIAQSLSTFSGHMRTIAEYVSAAGPRSLVLLDELGAGTDPEEGSALAMAILDHLREVGAISFVTTHHSALKAYAYSHDDVSNASVEFDTETLRPAFRLLTGVPGSSHALTIAERTGIPHAVVERAHRYMNEQQSDSAQLIRRLTEQEHAVRSEQQRLAEEREEAQRRSREAEARQRSLDERERTLREEGIGRLERFTADARRRLENLIRELREREITRADTKRAKQFVQELEQAAEQEEASLQAEQEQRGSADSAEGGVGEAPATEGEHGPPPEERDHPAQLNPGAAVKLRGPGTRGVLRRRAKGNRWVVQTDTVTVTVPESELIALARRDQPEQKPQYAVSMSSPNQHVPQELDVRGMRMAEADDAVRRYIDEALLANRDTIGIIHGKGEGVLQSGVRDILGQHPSVERYEYAVPENGGFGKTVAYLKREHA